MIAQRRAARQLLVKPEWGNILFRGTEECLRSGQISCLITHRRAGNNGSFFDFAEIDEQSILSSLLN